ncbi:MAG: hypothetical protein H0T73_23115, partial [Ardenticatenales bacterium]|nr:hypothetical protein [Ardenticatenales bacterium]
IASAGEWEGAGYYLEEGGVQANPQQIAQQLWYGFDAQNLYLRLDSRRPWVEVGEETRIGFYLTRPGGGADRPFSRIGEGETLLGFGANALVEVTVRGDETEALLYVVQEDGSYTSTVALEAALAESTIEVQVPYETFGKPDAGDTFRLRTVISEAEVRDIQAVPGSGPGEVAVPDLGLSTALITVQDPEGDDHGPGEYTYPNDAVFKAGAYDLTEFVVAEDENNMIFRFTFAGPVNNDWGAPNGMGIHTLDVYINTGEGGARKLLPGRNASVPEENGWEIALWAEGWTPGVYGPPAEGESSPSKLAGGEAMTISTDPAQNKITIRVAKEALTEMLGGASVEAASWRYLAVVMGQEGFPASGVWRVRDVNEQAEQYRFGGAPAESTTHTRILDVAYPEDFEVSQEEALGDFTPQEADTAAFDDLSPDDFAQLPMVGAQ